jgi:hypothetical protein
MIIQPQFSVQRPQHWGRRSGTILLGVFLCAWFVALPGGHSTSFGAEHPRLYFNQTELIQLRMRRGQDVYAQIWQNMVTWAEWCQKKEPRKEWIPTLKDDPKYVNLYDRFYAAMSDMAIVEHLALTSALSDPVSDPFFDSARKWALNAARVWRHEADNAPDASKAYAVLRIVKGLAVAYDVLYDRLSVEDRDEIRQTILDVGRPYFKFFQLDLTAGKGYNKHHGSVDASPFGIMALALLGDEPEVEAWLHLAIRKHVDYLLPEGLTPSGTSEQSSNFWASTLQYRILFIDPLRRVTGRDLFAEFPASLPGNIALAAVAGGQPRELEFNEHNRSVIFGPSYGQLDYWSPVLVYLARHHKQSIYQHLALWDESMGSLQRSRYISQRQRNGIPFQDEELLFCFGPYAYMWYDSSIPAAVDKDLPLSFEFPEPDVNEVYLRASYNKDDMVVGMKKGGIVVHAGGHRVFVDELNVEDTNNPREALEKTVLSDDGKRATLRCTGSHFGEQHIELQRPSDLTIDRQTSETLTWWFSGPAEHKDNMWTWPNGTQLTLLKGNVVATIPEGVMSEDTEQPGFKFSDRHPFAYPRVTVKPVEGRITVQVTNPPVSRRDGTE